MKITAYGRTFEVDAKRVRGGLPQQDDTRRGYLPRKGSPSNGQNDVPRAQAPAPKYDSKWEERYAQVLEMEKATGTIERFWYHPFSMWLPGKVRYTPDFLIQYPGHLQIVEIKGWSKNLRDGMTRLKIAASIFPCYNWYVAKWNGKDFDFIPVEVDPW